MANSWLITGGSSGFGLSIGRVVLEKGGTAILTTRNVERARKRAPDVEEKGGIWLQLRLEDKNLEESVKRAVDKWKIDCLVNNAGYPVAGAVEDISTADIRAEMEVNFVAPIRIIQAVLPTFRQRRAGTIVSLGSGAAFSVSPAGVIYAASKCAFGTMTEGLTKEVAPFNIRVLLFEPGPFQTNFGTDAVYAAGLDGGVSDAYKGTVVEEVIGMLRKRRPAPGNPDLAALRIYEVVTKTGMASTESIVRLSRFPLGTWAFQAAAQSAQKLMELLETTKEIATSTDYEKPA